MLEVDRLSRTAHCIRDLRCGADCLATNYWSWRQINGSALFVRKRDAGNSAQTGGRDYGGKEDQEEEEEKEEEDGGSNRREKQTLY